MPNNSIFFCINSNAIYIIDDVQEPQLETKKLEKENNNVYRIIGIIDGHYIIQTPEGKKVKVSEINKEMYVMNKNRKFIVFELWLLRF